MIQGKACLNCLHFKGVAPSDWKADFESQDYTFSYVIINMRKTGLHEAGKCTIEPAWQDVTTNHHCSRWEQVIDFVLDVHQLIGRDWRDSRIEAADRVITQLKKELKAARKISASRLARLLKRAPLVSAQRHREPESAK